MEFETVSPPRPHYRPPIGIPIEQAGRARGALASIAIHLLILFLLVAPPLIGVSRFDATQQGAGGPGPAGGGGGGTRGTGGSRFIQERLQFIHIGVEPAATPQLQPQPVPPPPPTEVKPKVEPPPQPVQRPQSEQPAAAESKSDSAASPQVASTPPGTGGGTGNDGSAGNGPGMGGGVGSGIGTGHGSGNGPGTGGGEAAIYPPTVIALPILPLPVPAKVRPYRMLALFEVDSTGRAKLLGFNPSKDAGYNKRILEMLSEIRFRPAVRAIDGRPVRDTARIIAEAP